MTFLFWLLISLTIYCYFGYPLLLWLMARLWPDPVQKGSYEPKISVILSVWNEEDVIKEKLRNLLSLDYPKEKMEILVGSDGSTDKTTQIIRGFNDPRIHLLERPRRQGKMATLNELVQAGGKKKKDVLFSPHPPPAPTTPPGRWRRRRGGKKKGGRPRGVGRGGKKKNFFFFSPPPGQA